jgi:hypothetical protein
MAATPERIRRDRRRGGTAGIDTKKALIFGRPDKREGITPNAG